MSVVSRLNPQGANTVQLASCICQQVNAVIRHEKSELPDTDKCNAGDCLAAGATQVGDTGPMSNLKRRYRRDDGHQKMWLRTDMQSSKHGHGGLSFPRYGVRLRCTLAKTPSGKGAPAFTVLVAVVKRC